MNRHRQQTFERAGRALAQCRDRRHDEHHDERKDRQDWRADVIEVRALICQHPSQQRQQHSGDDEQQRHRSWITPQLVEHTSGGGECAAGVHDARLDQSEKHVVEVVGAGAPTELGRRAVGQHTALAQQQQSLAVLGFVHDVTGDDQADAVARELPEQLPEVAAKHRIEADCGFVEHEQLRGAEQCGRERYAGLLAARQPADDVRARGRAAPLRRARGRRPPQRAPKTAAK